jgi:cytoskeletal protein CcmA (bactofilin family)
MLNFGRRDPVDPKGVPKPALKPAFYEPPGAAAKTAAGNAPRPAMPLSPPPQSAAMPPTPSPSPTEASAPAAATASASIAEPPGSKLSVGVNIKLKGVDISDCDVLVIEGSVEATVHSKAMQIAKPGTLKGTALIDVAEIHGEFSGELTARMRLVVHSTGRVSGTIRYGKLIVAEGGELTGDVKRLEAADEHHTQPSRGSAAGTPLGTVAAPGVSPR